MIRLQGKATLRRDEDVGPWWPAEPSSVRGAGTVPLMRNETAQRLLGTIADALERDVYLYQQPLAGRAGPRVMVGGQPFLLMSSYDYLGLIGDARIHAAATAAIERYGTGTGGVRILTGTIDLHRRLERELALIKGAGGALTFTSGYMANLAAVATLLGPRDCVVADEYAHRSLVDACRLARVPLRRFAHDDPADLERELERRRGTGRCMVIVEGVYSMDGDVCSLPDIVALKRRYDAFLLVDESHALGVLGRHGYGVHEHYGLSPRDVDLWTGSLSKAIPSNGGFLAGSAELMVYLQHAAAPFIFSSACAPASVAAAREALTIVREEPERRTRVMANAARLRQGLRRLGFDVGRSSAAIVPVIVGTDEAAHTLARRLYALGVLTSPIVYPAVPAGSARLRLCATAAQDADDLDFAIEAFRQARQGELSGAV